MIAGVDVRFVVPLWAIVLAFVFSFHYFFVLPVGVVAHLFLAWLFKSDPNIVDVYLEYTRQADVYDPWPHIDSPTKRPEGFGRDLLC
ncbi:VirB3 family type IV secretion system protein [Undibacterium arcticum]